MLSLSASARTGTLLEKQKEESEKMTAKDIALKNEILRGVVGSTAHGTAVDGQDDRDEMGVFIEPQENVCGLTPLDHYIYRDAAEGQRSRPGDLDLTMYSLRKFCRLAAQGNPSIICLLWLPEYEFKTDLGQRLIDLRDAFISRESGQRFLGYLVAQRMKMTGERTQTVKRTDLLEKYGYDTKFAMHALRLGYQGIQLMTEWKLTLPAPEPYLSELRAVRTGQVSFQQALSMINAAENALRIFVDNCERVADIAKINAFMAQTHQEYWWRHPANA